MREFDISVIHSRVEKRFDRSFGLGRVPRRVATSQRRHKRDVACTRFGNSRGADCSRGKKPSRSGSSVNMKALLKRVIPAGARLKLRQAQTGLIDYFPRGYRAVGLVAQTPEFWEGDGRYEFLRRAFRMATFNGISGDYVEFGCNGCRTFAQAFHEMQRTGRQRMLWAFDSFAGLPPDDLNADEHPQWVQGAMATGISDFHRLAKQKGVSPEAYRTVEGFYDRTIGPDALYRGTLPDDVAIAYVDCDLYTSTLPVLHFLRQRLKHGMIIAFDDYFCFSAARISGERRAFLEFQAAVPRFHFVEYQPFGWGGMSFIVEARDGNPSLPDQLLRATR